MRSLVRNLGLREKLVALALLVLVPLALLQVASITVRLQESARAEQEHSREVASAVGASFVRYLNYLWGAQHTLGHTIVERNLQAAPEALDQFLQGHIDLSGSVLGLAWLDGTGALRSATLPESSPLLPAMLECFQKIAAGTDEAVSSLVQIPGGPAVLVVSAGIREGIRLQGVVISLVDAARLGAELPMPRQGADSYQLVDRKGQVVFHSQVAAVPEELRRLAADSPVRHALRGQTRRFTRERVDLDRTDRLGAAVPIPSIGWAVVASTPTAERLGPAYVSAWLQAAALVISLITSLGAALYLGGRLLRPILALTDAARSIALGHLGARAGAVPARDELAAAVNTFDQMAAQIQSLEEERDRFYTLSASLMATIATNGQFERFNPEWERTLGIPRDELMDVRALDLVHPDDRAAVRESIRKLESGVPTAEFECRMRCHNGAWKWFVWSAASFAARGVIYLVGQDITALKRAEAERIDLLNRAQAARAAAEEGQRRLALLAEAGSMLAASIDYQTTLTNVAHLAVPHLADWCTVSMLTDSGLESIAIAHPDPARAEWAAQQNYPAHKKSASWNAIRSAKPVVLPDVDDNWLQQVATSPEHYVFLQQLGIRSTMTVPMLVRGRVIGLLSFHYAESGRRYSPADLSLAEELALRAALAVENAMLYRESQAATARAEETVALLDTLLESAPVGMAFLDPSLRYVRVNDALAAMNGVPTQQHLSRTVREVVPQAAPVLEPILRGVMRTGEPVVAWEGVGHDQNAPGGSRYWMESIYPVRTAEGKVLGVGTVVTDITERKRMEEALRESELLLSGQKHVLEMIATGRPLGEIQNAIVQFIERQAPDSTCAVTPGDPAGASLSTPILAPNGEPLGALAMYFRTRREPRSSERALVEIFAHLAGIAIERHNAEEVRNRKLETLIAYTAEGVIAVDEEERLIVANAAAIRLLNLPAITGTPALAEAGLPAALTEILQQAALPDQRSPARHTITCGALELDVHVSPVVAGLGRHYGTIALLQDMTAMSRLRRLQESFVANVSHELRAPLATLSAMAEAINDGVASEEARGRYVKAILSETERLRRLTNDILELSRLDAGVVEIAREEFDIDLVLESVAENWDLRCAAAGVHLEVGRHPGYRVVADYDRVLQVLTNLVDNAVKFTPRGGLVRVDVRSAGGHLRLSITDTGPGIAAEHLPYVWQRFYIIDGARTRSPGSGTGLGLPIARHLVEEMGGEAGIESEPGRGSTFWFTLPLPQDTKKAPA